MFRTQKIINNLGLELGTTVMLCQEIHVIGFRNRQPSAEGKGHRTHPCLVSEQCSWHVFV